MVPCVCAVGTGTTNGTSDHFEAYFAGGDAPVPCTPSVSSIFFFFSFFDFDNRLPNKWVFWSRNAEPVGKNDCHAYLHA